MTHTHAEAFAPGHLTAFFRTFTPAPEIEKTGSLGAGICLSKGAYSVVKVEAEGKNSLRERRERRDKSGRKEADGIHGIEVRINDRPRKAEVTSTAVSALLSHAKKSGWLESLPQVAVETRLELPEKSGWGMSGAGALSTVLALREALELPLTLYETAYFAHLAELQHSTGLGDVVGQCTGGLEIRRIPGLPPHGFVDRIPVPDGLEIVCLTLPEPLSTSAVLSDPEKRRRIDTAGEKAVNAIIDTPTLQRFLELSGEFTRSAGLASKVVRRALEAVKENGRGGMAMLGNSVFAIGNTEKLVEILSDFGRVDVCTVDIAGARLVKNGGTGR